MAMNDRVANARRRVTGLAIRGLSAMTAKRLSAVIRSFPDLDDSTRALTKVLLERAIPVTVLTNRKAVRPNWLDSSIEVLDVHSPRGLKAYLSASHVFFTHGAYGSPPPTSAQTIVNIWHGMPLKKIERDLGRSWCPSFSYTIATSPRFRTVVARSFGVSEDKVLLVGHPRTDILLSSPGTSSGSGFVAWLPTYRKSVLGAHHHDGSAQTGAPSRDTVEKTCTQLAARGMRLVVKLHPMADPIEFGSFRDGGATVVDDCWLSDRGLTLYEWLSGASALVTDYSSIAVDFLVTGRPVVIAVGDLSEYRASRGLNFSLPELALLGTIVEDMSELPDALAQALGGPGVGSGTFDLYYSVERGSSTEDLLDRVGL